jgi:hypothetical protein
MISYDWFIVKKTEREGAGGARWEVGGGRWKVEGGRWKVKGGR